MPRTKRSAATAAGDRIAAAAADRIAARLGRGGSARLAKLVSAEAKREANGVSEAVREAIRASGLSLLALAQRSGVDAGVLSRFMRDERSMTLETLDRLAPDLGVRLTAKRPRKTRAK